MDRRNALFALCVFVLFACDDYGHDCDDEVGASWGSNDVRTSGTVTLEGDTHSVTSATRDGFELLVSSSLNEPLEDAGSDIDAHADAGSSHGYGYPATYDTSRRLRVEVDAQRAPGTYRLEDTHAFALVCPRGSGFSYYGDACTAKDGETYAPERVALRGTLEVLDIQVDVSAPGAPTTPPYEMPWGWELRTTNDDLVIDVRAVSRPRWTESRGYCD
jgi:hypothetical protein